MDPTLSAVIVFIALTLVILAIGSLVQDFRSGAGDATGYRKGSLRRALNVNDEVPSDSLTGRIDQGFDRLVLESGMDLSSFGALAMILAGGLLVGGSLFVWRDNLLGGAIGGVIGMLLTIAVMLVVRARRMAEIREALPDVIDLLSRAVRAGESIDQAITLVGDDSPGAVGKEFRQCSQQLKMGMSLAAVMRSLMRRIRLMEIRILASTLMVHRATGGNLPLTLERMSGVIRERLNYRRQMRAATGAGRTSTILIASAGPIIFLGLFFWQFEHLSVMFTQPVGQVLLASAAVLEFVGLVWVAGMLQSDY